MAILDQTTSQKLEENPLLPIDTQTNLVYTLTRIFRVLAQIVNPLVAWVATFAGISVTHDSSSGATQLLIEPVAPKTNASASLVLAKSAPGGSNTNTILGRTGIANRWIIQPGNGEPETGANAGSNFGIYRYADDGSFINATMTMNRANGNAIFYAGIDVATNSVFRATGNAIDVPSGGIHAAGDLSTNAAVTAGTVMAATGDTNGNAFYSANGSILVGGSITASKQITSNSGSAAAFNAPNGGAYLNAAYGLNCTGYYADGANWYSRITSTNPNWGAVDWQGYHQPGVWAGCRFIPGGGPITNFQNDGTIHGVGYVTSSDVRLKGNIEGVTDALGKVSQLQAFLYTFPGAVNDGEFDFTTQLHMGLIAQDVLKTVPVAVSVPPQPPEGEKPDSNATLGIDYAAISALNSQAIGELLALVQAQEQRIAALETAAP